MQEIWCHENVGREHYQAALLSESIYFDLTILEPPAIVSCVIQCMFSIF